MIGVHICPIWEDLATVNYSVLTLPKTLQENLDVAADLQPSLVSLCKHLSGNLGVRF